jgi:hypothetical protein
MNCITRQGPNLFLYGAQHFANGYIDTVDLVKATVARDLQDSGLSLADIKNNTVVLDFTYEGQSDKDIVNVIAYLRSVPVQKVAAIFSANVNVSELDYPATVVLDATVDVSEWYSRLKQHDKIWHTDCNFLCLMRRPSINRAKLGSRLLTEFASLRMSFASMCRPDTDELSRYQPWFPNHPLPLLLDGVTTRRENTNDHPEYDAINPLFRTCAVNIIAESSSQSGEAWTSVFVTEKTFKAFAMLQLPIWWAVPGVVACVRQMGFDLFDDIIDHSYDSEQEEDCRLELVIQQLKTLEKLNLIDLRSQLKHRLAANWQKLDNIVQDRQRPHQLKRIFHQLNL